MANGETIMTTIATPHVFEEIAEFFATFPTRQQILDFRPSSDLQEWGRELLWKSNASELSDEEQEELAEFGRAELIVRLIKARL
jgi:hypothetical protein